MKICFVTGAFYPATYYGGPIFSTYKFARVLANRGLEVSVITTNANGKERLDKPTGIFIKDSENLNIKYYSSLDSRSTSLVLLSNLKNDLKAADLIYLVSVFSPSTPLTLYLSKKLTKPLIISPRGELGSWCLNQGSRFKKQWLKLFIKPFIKSIYWHTTSDEEERMVKGVYPEAKTFVLPNGIDLHKFNSLPLERNKSFYDKFTGYKCSQKKIIISMGRLHKIKGFDILIQTFHNLQKDFSESVLLIAGEDFGEKSNLENIITQKELESKVFLIGKLDGNEKLEFMYNADVFALASHHENFGMVYAESLAAGTPIIASKNTPWQEIEKYNCGKWVENTPEKFTLAIKQILNSDTLKMGELGRKYASDNFDWDKIAIAFISKVENILTIQ